MFVTKYIKKMVRGFKLRRVLEEIDVTRDELLNQTLPIIGNVLEASKRDGFKSETYRLHQDLFRRQLKGYTGNNIFEPIHNTLDNCVRILTVVQELADKEFQEDITPEGLTLRNAHTLQLLDGIAMYVKYSRRLADAVLIAEEKTGKDSDGSELDTLTQADLDYLSENRTAFITLTDTLATPATTIEEMYKLIPDMVVSEVRSDAALSVHGKDKVDPLRFGFYEARFNPIWLLATNGAERQAKRYQEAKQDAELLALRIQRYKRMNEGKSDPKMEQIIRNREKELDLIRAKLYKMENIR